MSTLEVRKKMATQARYVVDPPFPTEIFVDLTSHCNHACVFCSNVHLKNKRTMDPKMVIRVLQEAYANGTRDIGLYATGESFLIKDLDKYVREAKCIGYEYLFITTNGSLATPEKVKPVLDAGLDSIKFSISSGTREGYRRIHGKDDFERVIQNLSWISEYREKSGLRYRIYVTMVYTDQNRHEVDLLRNIVGPYIDEWDPHLLTNQCGNKLDNNALGRIEEGNIRGRVKSEICFQPFKGFTVTPEGYVSACVLDYQKYLIIGDLNRTPMETVWLSKRYREFRKRHIQNRLKGLICYNCIYNAEEAMTPVSNEFAKPFAA